MIYRRLVGVALIGILVFCGLVSCKPSGGPSPTPTETPTPGQTTSAGEFEVIRQAADAYMNSGTPLYITANAVYDSMMAAGTAVTPDFKIEWYNPSEYPTGPFIIDVRDSALEMPDLYLAGHVPGAVHIPLPDLMQHLGQLPRDRQIVVVSGNGAIGGAAAAILNVLGYNAVNLMWGMTAWTGDETIAPGRYTTKDSVFDWSSAYRAVCPISEPTETYSFPVVDYTGSNNIQTILEAAANAYLADTSREFDLTGEELHKALYYAELEYTTSNQFESEFFTGTATENPYVVPFFLDVRDDDSYLNGHLCGSLHVLWKDLFKPENLDRVPLDRHILVVSDTGHESAVVSTLLNLLGYDAVNLRWGIIGWSLEKPGKSFGLSAFNPSKDVMNYQTVSGYNPFMPKPSP
jgi:rhodanese-related sulfurtransferase